MTDFLENVSNNKENDDTPKEKRKPSVIHLSLVIGGARSTLQAVTLMKSIFYYHTSLQHDISNNIRLEVSPKGAILPRYQHLYLHLVVERMAYRSLSTLLDSWNLPGLFYSFYPVEKYLEDVVWIPTNHYSGIYGLAKIILTDILPQTLEKVIFLDCDLLMNADISQLWAHFDQFLSRQVIGLAENQSPWYVMRQSSMVWPAIGSGYNTGVMLLHLERLRRLPWNHLWRNTTTETLKFLPYAPLADQASGSN
ncbi:glycosyltransferase-like protein LARGE [Paragonimus westermani]|uniref:Glycosyltransferase-like protein LARGE n=1 Tax=Paragonimus westermani TaxID=34504 RepID=A0A5J4NL51_9TREM|nr:glycosyltransferase-like protein LARGE [Paragonimus westermani]